MKLSGQIADYRRSRESASFVFTSADQATMGLVAVAAGVAGAAGLAIGTAANATQIEEEADRVEFRLGDHHVQGWLWRSPFSEGDEVEVLASRRGDHFEAIAIARPSDRTIALFPHCSRGRWPHLLIAAKWWLLLASSGFAFVCLMLKAPFSVLLSEGIVLWAALGFYGFFGLMITSLARKWWPFVRGAESVFRALGWARPGWIDLKRITRSQRTKSTPVEYGRFYFYY